MPFVTKLIQFVLCLTCIVSIHELGHLLFAKFFGMRVRSYMIGFPPKLFGLTFKGTEYALGAIPLGGAVQIDGMVDEALDGGHMATEVKPWEFRAKPAWQRLVVILGGIVFNLLLGYLLHIGMLYVHGELVLSKDRLNCHGIYPNPQGVQLGFREGDKIIKINDEDFQTFDDVVSRTLMSAGDVDYTIERDGIMQHIVVPSSVLEPLRYDPKLPFFIEPRQPYTIRSVADGSSFSRMGLRAGNELLAIGGEPVRYIHQLAKVVRENVGNQVSVSYLQDGHEKCATITIELGTLSLQSTIVEPMKYPLLKSIAKGCGKVNQLICQYVIGIWQIITGKMSLRESISGPIGIFQAMDSHFVLVDFVNTVAVLSISIGLMNALPIPALDGGHAVLIVYEWILRKKVPDRGLLAIQNVGMFLLLSLILFVVGNDIIKLICK